MWRAWSVNRNFVVSSKTKILTKGKFWFANFTKSYLKWSAKKQSRSTNRESRIRTLYGSRRSGDMYFLTWHHVKVWSEEYVTCSLQVPQQRNMWLAHCKSLNLNRPCAKFDACRCCGSGDKTFHICHVTLYDRVIMGHITLLAGPPHPKPPLCQLWYF